MPRSRTTSLDDHPHEQGVDEQPQDHGGGEAMEGDRVRDEAEEDLFAENEGDAYQQRKGRGEPGQPGWTLLPEPDPPHHDPGGVDERDRETVQ